MDDFEQLKLKEIAEALKAGGSVEHAVNALLKLAGEYDEPEEKKPAKSAPPVAKKK